MRLAAYDRGAIPARLPARPLVRSGRRLCFGRLFRCRLRSRSRQAKRRQGDPDSGSPRRVGHGGRGTVAARRHRSSGGNGGRRRRRGRLGSGPGLRACRRNRCRLGSPHDTETRVAHRRGRLLHRRRFRQPRTGEDVRLEHCRRCSGHQRRGLFGIGLCAARPEHRAAHQHADQCRTEPQHPSASARSLRRPAAPGRRRERRGTGRTDDRGSGGSVEHLGRRGRNHRVAQPARGRNVAASRHQGPFARYFHARRQGSFEGRRVRVAGRGVHRGLPSSGLRVWTPELPDRCNPSKARIGRDLARAPSECGGPACAELWGWEGRDR